MDKLIKPELGATKADKVTRTQVARLHGSLKKTPFQANLVLAVIASMYAFAGRSGVVHEGEILPAGSSSSRSILTFGELERLGSAIRPDLDSETIEVGRRMRARLLATCSAELHHQSGRDQRGKLLPLTRQLFVLPFTFTARAVGKVLAFCRPRLEFFSHINEPTPEQAIALHPCGWIRGGKGRIRDWHNGTQISLATLTCAPVALAL